MKKYIFTFIFVLSVFFLQGHSYYLEGSRSPSISPLPNRVDYLVARGSGTIIIEADYADITVRMKGSLYVSEPEFVYVDNYRSSRMGKWKNMEVKKFRGVRGEVSYVGSNFIMVINGSVNELQISGSARIKFKGQGRIVFNDDRIERWNGRKIISLLM